MHSPRPLFQHTIARLAFTTSLVLSLAALVYSQTTAPEVPRMVLFNGIAKDPSGNPLPGTIGITFALYKDEEGGAPLWMEVQNASADAEGHYSVYLGATKSDGLPQDSFVSGEARWLGVQLERQKEQPRILLLSVPYALKAGDSQTLGGLPASAFVLAPREATPTSHAANVATHKAPPTSSTVITNGGTINTIPLFSTSTDIENSAITQTGSGPTANIGIGTPTPSSALDVNGTVNASMFNLGGIPFAFGDFGGWNSFIGFAGNTANPGLSNVGVGENALLSVHDGFGNVAVGIQALEWDTSGQNNTAIGNGALLDDNGTADTAVGVDAGADIRGFGTNGGNNTFLGAYTSPGYQTNLLNATAIGAWAEVDASNSMVLGSIKGVHSAFANTSVGVGTTKPTYLFHVGSMGTLPGFGYLRVDGPPQAGSEVPAISIGGAGDFQIDAPGVQAGRFVVRENGFVGIGTSQTIRILTIQGGKGHAIADGWDTWSSRRWKTNIQPLDGALAKVEQLRGVSYDRLETGKHEIGVIAEEVGQVVPEVVSYEENGKDAQGVDYSRLTALLIEAVKEQQKQIRQQQAQIRLQEKRVQAQQSEIAHLCAHSGTMELRLSKIESLHNDPSSSDAAQVSTPFGNSRVADLGVR
jgi:Chaperone of endosialidase